MDTHQVTTLPAGATVRHLLTTTEFFDRDDKLRWQFAYLNSFWDSWNPDQFEHRYVTMLLPDMSINYLPFRRIGDYLSEFGKLNDIPIELSWREAEATWASCCRMVLDDDRHRLVTQRSRLYLDVLTNEVFTGINLSEYNCFAHMLARASLMHVDNTDKQYRSFQEVLADGVATIDHRFDGKPAYTHLALYDGNLQPTFYRLADR